MARMWRYEIAPEMFHGHSMNWIRLEVPEGQRQGVLSMFDLLLMGYQEPLKDF